MFFYGGVMQNSQHINIVDRCKVEINGVASIRSFDEDSVMLDTSLGKIAVEGVELKIENFEKAKSEILITGKIIGVFYLEKREKKRG
jgi:sporulation protein YabP